MKTTRSGAERPAPEKPKTVIIMDGPEVVFVGYATGAQEKKLMEILMERRRKYAQ